MADPEVKIIPADMWTKIATAIQTGIVVIKTNTPDAYFHDNRDTGGAAPTDDSTAINFDKSGVEKINNSVAIDVYVFAKGASGSVIVDV